MLIFRDIKIKLGTFETGNFWEPPPEPLLLADKRVRAIIITMLNPPFNMVIAPNSLVRQKEGLEGRRRRNVEEINDDRNSNVRRRRSHRSNSVRGVGCEEQEKA